MINAACSARSAQAAMPANCTEQTTGKPKLETPTDAKIEQAAVIDNVTTTVTEDAGTSDGGKKAGRAHGVLRLLEAGHFKAQPEYRHRLHFGYYLGSPTPEEDPQVDDGASEPTVVDDVDGEVAPPTQPPTTGVLEPLDDPIDVSFSLVDFFA